MLIESDKQPDISIRKAGLQDAKLLVELGRRAFYEAFAEKTAPKDMAAYLQATFNIIKIKSRLKDLRSLFFIIEAASNPAGYAYLYPTPTPECIHAAAAIQLIRFYLLKMYYGRGVGDDLMKACLKEAQEQGYRYVWLSSWQLNERANSFYKKWHFEIVGRQEFSVGSDIQQDFIFLRKI